MQTKQDVRVSIKRDISGLTFSLLKVAPITAQNALSFAWCRIDFSRPGNAATVCHLSFSSFFLSSRSSLGDTVEILHRRLSCEIKCFDQEEKLEMF